MTVLLIAANSMAMMVRDRITEVAVMRALGFGRIHVITLLLAEAALIGLVGAAVGAGTALWIFHRGIGCPDCARREHPECPATGRSRGADCASNGSQEGSLSGGACRQALPSAPAKA